MSEDRNLTIRIHHEDGHLWSEVQELPGCFASGRNMSELIEALAESIGQYVSDTDKSVKVKLVDVSQPQERVETRRLLVSA